NRSRSATGRLIADASVAIPAAAARITPTAPRPHPYQSRFMSYLCLPLAFLLYAGPSRADAPWITLLGDEAGPTWAEKTWRGRIGAWIAAGEAVLDLKDPRLLEAKPGKGVFVNGRKGRERDLVTKQVFGDLEVELEFLIAKGSNSGVKFHAVYEIQI